MDEKRPNSGLWKIAREDDEDPPAARRRVIAHYKAMMKVDRASNPPLHMIDLIDQFDDPALDNATLDLYIRIRQGLSVWPFVSAYVANESQKNRFNSRSVDMCLFIATDDSLFAVTSGSGYHIVQDHADYTFPFEVAKKLIANSFKATEVRSITGATTSRTETYRRGQSMGASDSFGKVWKRLVSRLDSGLLPEGSYLLKLIDPSRPPAIEVKSSFVLRKSLDLRQLVSLAQELDNLPEPSEEKRLELSFLDSLYPVKGKLEKSSLNERFIECVRNAVLGTEMDLDACDPDDVALYYAGSNFKLADQPLDGDPPDATDILKALRIASRDVLNDRIAFFHHFELLNMSYSVDPDNDSSRIRKSLLKFLHGQVEYEGHSYFLLDKVWYRIQGEFLVNLKRDFIKETFEDADPIFLQSKLGFMEWKGIDEGAYNIAQAKSPGFYFGDKIFAISDHGKVELFDLIAVDEQGKKLYVIHVKDGFDAKMRDACSQISMSAEIIKQDMDGDRTVLRRYYKEWNAHDCNRRKRISEKTFLSWFSFSIVYVVLVSTKPEFTAHSFRGGTYKSHIARRETLATRNEFRANGNVFRLAHTRRA